MKHRIRLVTLMAVSATLTYGCAIHQNVRPVSTANNKQICIVENSAVKHDFLGAYRGALESMGYVVRQLPTSSSITECPVTSTYSANWHWDLALYMVYAEINVYDEGKLIGQATYDARGGAGSLGKFISAERKIKELVNQLFPGGNRVQ